MTLAEFKSSLQNAQPPNHSAPLLQAMWHDGKQDWEGAHHIAQDVDTPEGSWVHAYLHRKEGDASNASYWYRMAGRPVPSMSLADEWDEIVKYLIR